MKKRFIVAAMSVLSFASLASAGTMNASFKYSIKLLPTFDIFNSWLTIGGGIYTKGAAFPQLLAEAQNSRLVYAKQLGWVKALAVNGPTVVSGSFVASTSSANTVPTAPANIGQFVRTMYVGIYNSPDGVEIAYDSLAGDKTIAANKAWTGASIPFLVPSSSTNGTVSTYDSYETESSLYNALNSGSAAQARPAAIGAMQQLASPVDADGDAGYALAEYNQIDSPAQAALFHHNIPMTSRSLRLVKYSNASDGGTAEITITGPFANVAGDFDGDDLPTAADIDLLFAADAGAVPTASGLYDLNNDDVVNKSPNTVGSDADYWVHSLAHTEYGDTNLDGKVNFDDLLTLAQNYGTATDAGWANGSFNGDGAVNFDDLLVLAQHYGYVAPGGIAGDLALANALVPEPAAMAMTSLLLLTLRRRRIARTSSERAK